MIDELEQKVSMLNAQIAELTPSEREETDALHRMLLLMLSVKGTPMYFALALTSVDIVEHMKKAVSDVAKPG